MVGPVAKREAVAHRDLANQRRRFGYRLLFILLRDQGEPSGINRIYRLYREEGLAVRKRRSRRKAVGTRAPILVEAKPNARWSLDFVHDHLACGRRFRILNIVDDVTRECLAPIPDTSTSGNRIARELTTLTRFSPPAPLPGRKAPSLCKQAEFCLETPKCGDPRCPLRKRQRRAVANRPKRR